MIICRLSLQRLPIALILLTSLLTTVQADDFDCMPTIDGVAYNFTLLGEEHQINRTRSTPPSTTIDSLTFNLCEDLKEREGVAEQDQCPSGSRACLTQINVKGEDPERIISVIPLAQTSKLAPNVTVSPTTPKFISILLHGSEYPQKSTDTTPSVPQLLNLTLWCEPQEPQKLEIEGYDGSHLNVAYFGRAGCPVDGKNQKPPPPGEGDDKSGSGEVNSGIGWFFLLLFLAILGYFVLGAYLNYVTYGARGLDLIPHRDFWQEVPYMLGDVVSHLCSSAKPRRSTRNGYIQV